MGGSSYDRDVYSSSSSSDWGASYVSDSKLSSTDLDPSMNPTHKTLRSNSKHPIIIVLDVTGSNIDFAKIVYDKLPMLYGQIGQKGYLDDFEISICAVGDAYTDNYPLQIGSFAKGIELDSWIQKLVLEGGGGSGIQESYEFAAYYLLKKTEFIPGAEPMLFFIGDESPYPKVNRNQAESFGMDYDGQIDVFKELRKKFKGNVFMFLNKYQSRYFKTEITTSWTERLAPEHTIMIEDEEKSIVDLILGTISILSGARTLDSYIVDMLDRGQTPNRIGNVKASLGNLEKALVPVKITGSLVTQQGINKPTTKSTRL